METTWIDTADISRDAHRTQLKTLNKHLSKVCAALISIGHYDFKVKFCRKNIDGSNFTIYDKVARIKNLPSDSQYSHIDVYHDGYVGYFNAAGSLLFEGISKTSSVKRDILK